VPGVVFELIAVEEDAHDSDFVYNTTEALFF
jgi:hypothetical protein